MRFVIILAMAALLGGGVIAYQNYIKGLRGQSKVLRTSTKQMGAMKKNMGNIRKQMDANVGITGSGGVGGGRGSAGMKKNAAKRIEALQKQQLQQK